MVKTENNLAAHPFLAGMKPEHIRMLQECANEVSFGANQMILSEGQEAHQWYLLVSGKVAVEIVTHDRGALTIQTLGAGEVLGWSWLIPPYQWRFDARVLEFTRAISLDGAMLRARCEANPDFGYELLRRFIHVVAGRLQVTRLQLLDMYGGSVLRDKNL